MSLTSVRSVGCQSMNRRPKYDVKIRGSELMKTTMQQGTNKKSRIIGHFNKVPRQTELEGDWCNSTAQLIELVTVAKKSADLVAMKRLPSSDPQFNCALNSLNKLKSFSLTPDSLKSNPQVIKCMEYMSKHPKVKIRTEASNLLESWRRMKLNCLEPCNRSNYVLPKAFDIIPESAVGTKKAVDELLKDHPLTVKRPEEGSLRDKIRGNILEALSKVVTESSNEITEGRDPVKIAAAVELSMYNKTSSGKKMHARCRSILFNLKDPKNTELRRRVLLGEISPDYLVEMNAEEMASTKRKRENDEIRLKALFGRNSQLAKP